MPGPRTHTIVWLNEAIDHYEIVTAELEATLAARDAEVARLREMVGEYAADNCWSGEGTCPNQDGNTCLPCQSRALLAATEPKEAP
jgi:hypothetical protein